MGISNLEESTEKSLTLRDLLKVLKAGAYVTVGIASAVLTALIGFPEDQLPNAIVKVLPLIPFYNMVFFTIEKWLKDNTK